MVARKQSALGPYCHPSKKKAYERAGFATNYAYRKAIAASRKWSDRESRVWNSDFAAATTPEAKGCYYRAYVSASSGLKAWFTRHAAGGGGHYLHHYLTVHMGMSEEEWDDRYSGYS